MRFATSKETWDHIQSEYHGSTKIVTLRRQTLRQKFEVLQMREDESIQQYIIRVIAIVNQIRGLGYELSEE